MTNFNKKRTDDIISAFYSTFDDYADNPEFNFDISRLSISNPDKYTLRFDIGRYPNSLGVSYMLPCFQYDNITNLFFLSRVTYIVNEKNEAGELMVFISTNIKNENMDYSSYKNGFNYLFSKLIEIKSNENAEIITAIYNRFHVLYKNNLISSNDPFFSLLIDFTNNAENENIDFKISSDGYDEQIINNQFYAFEFENKEVNPETLEDYANPTENYIKRMFKKIEKK